MYTQVPRAAAMERREGRGPPTHRVRRGPRRRRDGRGRHGLPPVGGAPPRRDGPGSVRARPAPGRHEDPGEGGTGAASGEATPPSRFRRAQVASAAAAKVRSKRSGNRVWPLTPPAYAASTVPVALAEVQRLFLPDAHTPQHGVNAASPHVVTDQVLIKVTKTGDGDQCPTPEGIHQDGSEVSAVTMIKRDRVTSGGETRLWSLDATTGNYCANLASTPSTRPRRRLIPAQARTTSAAPCIRISPKGPTRRSRWAR